jgi:type IV secretion system protein TrbI
MTEEAAPVPSKLNPESLALRAKPPRAIRFKRGVIIAIAAGLSTSLAAVAWMALTPSLFHKGKSQAELSEPNGRPTSDALNGAPATYGDVPRLGPPLPGDLGRPILEHQQAMAGLPNLVDQQAVQTERDRQLAELKAARESGVLVQGRQAGGGAEAASATEPAGTGPAEPATLGLDQTNDPNAQGRKSAFVGTLDPRGDVNPHALTTLPGTVRNSV